MSLLRYRGHALQDSSGRARLAQPYCCCARSGGKAVWRVHARRTRRRSSRSASSRARRRPRRAPRTAGSPLATARGAARAPSLAPRRPCSRWCACMFSRGPGAACDLHVALLPASAFADHLERGLLSAVAPVVKHGPHIYSTYSIHICTQAAAHQHASHARRAGPPVPALHLRPGARPGAPEAAHNNHHLASRRPACPRGTACRAGCRVSIHSCMNYSRVMAPHACNESINRVDGNITVCGCSCRSPDRVRHASQGASSKLEKASFTVTAQAALACDAMPCMMLLLEFTKRAAASWQLRLVVIAAAVRWHALTCLRTPTGTHSDSHTS